MNNNMSPRYQQQQKYQNESLTEKDFVKEYNLQASKLLGTSPSLQACSPAEFAASFQACLPSAWRVHCCRIVIFFINRAQRKIREGDFRARLLR